MNIFDEVFSDIFSGDVNRDPYLSSHDRIQAVEAAEQFGITYPKQKKNFVESFLVARRQRNMIKAGIYNQ